MAFNGIRRLGAREILSLHDNLAAADDLGSGTAAQAATMPGRRQPPGQLLRSQALSQLHWEMRYVR